MTLHTRRAQRATLFFVLGSALMLLAGCSGGLDASSALNVNAVTSDPAAFTGQIVVKGVVQDVDPTGSTIVLIDETEYQTCGINPCGSAGLLPLYLPTSGAASPGGALYSGQLPVLEDTVVISGEIKSGPQGLYFDVERVERDGKLLISKG